MHSTSSVLPSSCPGLLLGPVVCAGSPHGLVLGASPGTRGTWGSGRAGCVLVAARTAGVREREGFSAEITHAASIPRTGHTCRDTETRTGRARRELRGTQRARGLQLHRRCSIPGRVCFKSLPPPSLPGEELLSLNWRMLQAPADEPEESCGKVKASEEAAWSCRVSPQLAAASPACCGRCHLQDREWPCGREVRGLRGAAGLSPPPRFNLQRARPVLSSPGMSLLLAPAAARRGRGGGHGSPPCLGPARVEAEDRGVAASLYVAGGQWGSPGRSRLQRSAGW